MSGTTLVWIFVGLSLCTLEAVVPTSFIALVMGLSALAVAPTTPSLPGGMQVALWTVLSLLLFALSRTFVKAIPPSRSFDAVLGETLTEIVPGETGRVSYEGQSWLAQCDDPTVAIAAQQPVRILNRQGTMLIITELISPG
ncbi:MAG: NfeD family protein [Alkalinema sp. FL-bin-369]|jgi:membrane protein implicated in regulation of membrane protease activity|nr:NfeD family protein [Leptolyngbyaceae cyanobacterium LF-bin-369]